MVSSGALTPPATRWPRSAAVGLIPCHLALDSHDNLWTAHIAGGPAAPARIRIHRRQQLHRLHPADRDTGSSDFDGTTALAVDPATDDLYVARTDRRVSVYDGSSGALLYEFAAGIPSEQLSGLAIDRLDRHRLRRRLQQPAGLRLRPSPKLRQRHRGPDRGHQRPRHQRSDRRHHRRQRRRRDRLAPRALRRWRLHLENGRLRPDRRWPVGRGRLRHRHRLNLNSDYKFRVVTNKGTDPATEVASSALSFKTLNPPNATATPTAAQNVSYFSADLPATIADNGPAPTNWRIELSADNGSTWKALNSGTTAGGTTATVSATATGLSLNTPYKFRVVANKGATAATEVASAPLSFNTLNPPAATVTLSPAAAITDSSAQLCAAIDDNGTLGTAWRIELSADNGSTWSHRSTPAPPPAPVRRLGLRGPHRP